MANVLFDVEYLGVPDISIDPTALEATLLLNSTFKESLALSTTGGVLDWNVLTGGTGTEAVRDGGFEEGYGTNPNWRAGSNVVPDILPISEFADGETHLLRFDFENPTDVPLNRFIDQVSLVSGVNCKGVGEIAWLDINPAAGTLSPGQTQLLVTYNAVGLEPGTYEDAFCVASNDPDEPLIGVPVIMNVVLDPVIFRDGFYNNHDSPC